jgi:hypothetical protein
MHVGRDRSGVRPVLIDQDEFAHTGAERDRHGRRGPNRADAMPSFMSRSRSAVLHPGEGHTAPTMATK